MIYITGPANTELLDRLVADNRATDARMAEEEARRQRERNDEIYTKAVRRFFGLEDR